MQVLVEVADAGLGVVGVLLCEACLFCLSYAVCSCYHLSGFVLGQATGTNIWVCDYVMVVFASSYSRHYAFVLLLRLPKYELHIHNKSEVEVPRILL